MGQQARYKKYQNVRTELIVTKYRAAPCTGIHVTGTPRLLLIISVLVKIVSVPRVHTETVHTNKNNTVNKRTSAAADDSIWLRNNSMFHARTYPTLSSRCGCLGTLTKAVHTLRNNATTINAPSLTTQPPLRMATKRGQKKTNLVCRDTFPPSSSSQRPFAVAKISAIQCDSNNNKHQEDEY